MSPSSWTVAAVPWLVMAWIVTVVIVSALIYLILRAVLSKTEPQSLPEVLRALTPLVRGVTQALARLPVGSSPEAKPQLDTPTGQTGDDGTIQTEETS